MHRRILRLLPVGAITLVLASPLATSQSSGAVSGEYSSRGADSCIACHDDAAVMSLFHTGHAVPSDARTPFGAGQLQCEACHGPGGAHAGRVRRGQERPPVIRFGSDAETPVNVQNGMCLGCHEASPAVVWHGTAHDDGDVACADCHSSHAAADPVLTTSGQAAVCFDCHTRQRAQSMKPFSHPIRDGKMDCGACHNPHSLASDVLLIRETLNDTCFECHAEKRGPYLWEHAPVAEDCSNCHEPHGSSHPGMLSLRGPMLCQSCHSQAGHPSVVNDAAGLPEGNASKYLLVRNCLNCHTQVHGSNHPSGSRLMR